MKLGEVFGIFCNKKIPKRLKGKFSKTVMRPAIMYTSVNRKIEQRMRMLMCMSEVTKGDN